MYSQLQAVFLHLALIQFCLDRGLLFCHPLNGMQDRFLMEIAGVMAKWEWEHGLQPWYKDVESGHVDAYTAKWFEFSC